MLGGVIIASLPTLSASSHPLESTLKCALQEIADASARKYSCTFAIALRGEDSLQVSVGSGPDGAEAMFVWGSVTKMITGVSVLRAAHAGYFALDDPVAPILDPYFAAQGAANMTLEGLFGPLAKRVTVRQLATMTAGVPDYDTAKPNETDFSKSTDPFRAIVYRDPSKDWSPFDLLRVPWVAKGEMAFPPGTDKDYSSTNFVLLGLVLAATVGHGVSWDRFDQLAFRPPHAVASGLLNHSRFARHGAPSDYTSLDAFDRTSYNGHNASSLPGTSVRNVHGVFGGWTASDLVAPVMDVADLAFDIYGPQSDSSLVSAADIAMMVNKSQVWYGFATFLLNAFTGLPTDAPPPAVDYGTCYGHLGATYGWNSVAFFTPGTNISISVATNTETNEQAGPSDAYCLAYNRVRQILAGDPVHDCSYVASGYFGTCVCPGTKYKCEVSHDGNNNRRCVVSHFATQSYSECAKSCR